MKVSIVHSSNGDFIIDYETGKVICFNGSVEQYLDILYFDVIEYASYYDRFEEEYDILDLGYECGNGVYEKPCSSFRRNVKIHDKQKEI